MRQPCKNDSKRWRGSKQIGGGEGHWRTKHGRCAIGRQGDSALTSCETAIFGKDPNWGRVVAAAGYSGADIDQDKISLKFLIIKMRSCLLIQDGS